MNLVWFSLYLPDTRQHVGNLKFQLMNGTSWSYTPDPRNGLFQNHPLCFPHGGSVSQLDDSYDLNEGFGAKFGSFAGFNLQGFDSDLRYHLVTPTFGSFDAFFIPEHLYSFGGTIKVVSPGLQFTV